MAQCSVCGAEASFLSQRKIKNGIICGECSKKIPRVLSGTLQAYDMDDISKIIDYASRMKSKNFSATSSYGKLHIDEMNGLIAICDKVGNDGAPVGNADIFDCLYLEKVGLYPTDPRQQKKDIVCDVELHWIYRIPKMDFKVVVKKATRCEYKKINKTQVSWTEPGDLTMFRSMLDQTIQNAVKKALEERTPTLNPYDLDLMKARAIFHVHEGCSDEVIRRQYENMKKMYENGDYSKEDVDYYVSTLTRYYQLLSQG